MDSSYGLGLWTSRGSGPIPPAWRTRYRLARSLKVIRRTRPRYHFPRVAPILHPSCPSALCSFLMFDVEQQESYVW